MGAADPACSVHRGTNDLLEMSKNQQPLVQHHIDGQREKEKASEKGKRMEGERASGCRDGGKGITWR